MGDLVKGVGIALQDERGRFLLHHRDNNPRTRNPDRLALFGGGIDKGESPIESSVRELKEELDFVADRKVLYLIEELRGEGYVSYIFGYSKPVRADEVRLRDEGQGMYFYTREQIAEDDRCLDYLKRLFPCSH